MAARECNVGLSAPLRSTSTLVCDLRVPLSLLRNNHCAAHSCRPRRVLAARPSLLHRAPPRRALTPKLPMPCAQEQGMLRLTPMLASSRLTLSASQPWSNSWPSGELLLVRRACLPSRQSRLTYRITLIALTKNTQRGGSGSAAEGRAGRAGGLGWCFRAWWGPPAAASAHAGARVHLRGCQVHCRAACCSSHRSLGSLLAPGLWAQGTESGANQCRATCPTPRAPAKSGEYHALQQ